MVVLLNLWVRLPLFPLLFHFHFSELFFRLFYLSISYCFTTIFFYSYKFSFFLFIFSSFTSFNIIFTDPLEAFYSFWSFAFLLSLFIHLPILFFHIYFYFVPALYFSQLKFFKSLLVTILLLIFFTEFIIKNFIIAGITNIIYIHQFDHLITYVPKIIELINIYSYLSILGIIIWIIPICLKILIYQKKEIYEKIIIGRKYAYMSILIGTALIIPGDIIMMIMIMIPIIIILEISIIIIGGGIIAQG